MINKKIIQSRAGKSNYIWSKREIEIFAEALLKIKTKQEMVNFLLDLLTPKEIAETLRRFLVAYLILKGFTYQEIEDGCKMNPNTVTKIRKQLFYSNNALRNILENFVIKEIDEIYQEIVMTRTNHKINKSKLETFKPVIYGHIKNGPVKK